MFQRARNLSAPVTIELDGTAIPAERAEPLAVSLLAADKAILARSPKLHRPRSASCLRGGCDGCLMRVDGVPNVMTCLHAVQGNERVESQNVVGSRKADLLRVTDWFFPKGIDHHHLMAGVPALGGLMQSFARKIAGLGRLPSEIEPPRDARIVEADVSIVGAGLAGLVVAERLRAAGARVVLVDDGVALGGSLLALPEHAPRLDALREATRGDLTFARATAIGVYLGDLLVARQDEALVVRAKEKVFATGAHDGVLAFPGNDVPGVFSARALCLLHAYGLEPDGKVVLAGEGFWADELARRLGDIVHRVAADAIVGVEGAGHLRRVRVRDAKAIKASVLAISAPPAPSFEVAAQAGAEVRFDPLRGYAIVCDERGAAGPGLWAVGECTGAEFNPDELTSAAERCAASISRR